jgi:hypothetical protein
MLLRMNLSCRSCSSSVVCHVRHPLSPHCQYLTQLYCVSVWGFTLCVDEACVCVWSKEFRCCEEPVWLCAVCAKCSLLHGYDPGAEWCTNVLCCMGTTLAQNDVSVCSLLHGYDPGAEWWTCVLCCMGTTLAHNDMSSLLTWARPWCRMRTLWMYLPLLTRCVCYCVSSRLCVSIL